MSHCVMCMRERLLTTHHLICKSMWGRSWFKNRFSNKEMKSRTIEICRECHSAIHDFYTEKELAQNYNTLEKIMALDNVKKFVEWISKKA